MLSSSLRDREIDHLPDRIIGAVACDDDGPQPRIVEGSGHGWRAA